MDRLKKAPIPVTHTYGYLTKSSRTEQGLQKSHINDAFVIADGGGIYKRSLTQYLMRQVRKCNRKLRRGDRSHLINTAPRFINAFQRYDKVLWRGMECFIFGRRVTGYFDLKKLDGTKVFASAKASEITLFESARTLLIERRRIPLHAGLPA